MAKIIYPTYTMIARQAPHPNAAKVMTAYLLGSTKLTKDAELPIPYNKGKSLELLEGLAYWHEPGVVSPRNDVPYPKGGEVWDKMKAWTVDPEFIWKEGPKVRDFWTKHSAK